MKKRKGVKVQNSLDQRVGAKNWSTLWYRKTEVKMMDTNRILVVAEFRDCQKCLKYVHL